MGENETRFLSLSGQGFQLIRGTVMAEKKEFIRIRGARENNLKALNVDIPRNQFVVFTGLSGSGKSSLAFDTIYAEGQRRYMESLSSYARQFLGQMEKPNVDSIEGLPPAISIDQKSTNRNPRSTVGTVTEIYDYFRLLYARIGIPHCPKCGKVISRQSVDQMVDQIMALPERTKIQLLAPVVRGRKGRHEKVLEQAKRSGYVRVMIDGSQYELSEEITLDKNLKHNISIIVDRLVVKPDIEKRLTDSVENVLDLADGLLVVDTMDGNQLNFSQSFSCPDCGIGISEIEPRSFSFNNPFGACPECFGLGYKMEFDEDLLVGLESGKYDIGTKGAWWTAAREESYIFPEHYIGTSILGIVIRSEDAGKITDMESFAAYSGNLVPISPQNAQYSIVQNYNKNHPDAQVKLTELDNFGSNDAYQWVLEGRYDGYIDIRRIFDTRVLAEDGEYHQYADKLSYVPYEAIPTWAFFNKNNQELADEFDKAWEEVYEEGTFEELAQKYFGYSLFDYVPEGYKKGDEL